MKYTSTVLAVLASSALAYKPAEPVCSVVTVTKYGSPVWVPAPATPTWGDVPAPSSTTTTKDPWADVPAESTSTTKDPWSDVPAPSSTTTTTTKDPWSDVPAESSTTTTTTTKDPWSDVPDATSTTSSKPLPPKPTTTAPSSTKPPPSTTLSTTTTTTSSVSKPKATCPAHNKQVIQAGGSCGCGFQVNCGAQTNPTKDSKFWQAKEGQQVATLAECNALCDANALCTATLWVDEASSKDYHLCFQTSGLPAPAGSGYAQLSYKQSCSGKCTESYNTAH